MALDVHCLAISNTKTKGEETYPYASSPIQFNHRAFRLYGNSINKNLLVPFT